MKKLLLAALLGLFGFAANASTPVQVNNVMCPGTSVTVTWYCYDYVTCAVTLVSPTYGIPLPPAPPLVFDLDNPSTWGGTPPPSYSLYAAVVTVSCAKSTYNLPVIYVMAACGPTFNPPVPQPCCGSVADDFTTGGGGGIAYQLNIHP